MKKHKYLLFFGLALVFSIFASGNSLAGESIAPRLNAELEFSDVVGKKDIYYTKYVASEYFKFDASINDGYNSKIKIMICDEEICSISIKFYDYTYCCIDLYKYSINKNHNFYLKYFEIFCDNFECRNHMDYPVLLRMKYNNSFIRDFGFSYSSFSDCNDLNICELLVNKIEKSEVNIKYYSLLYDEIISAHNVYDFDSISNSFQFLIKYTDVGHE